MKLNINPKELLALYNVLYERFESSAGGTCYKEDDERVGTDTQLRQLYGRVKACIIASLSNKLVDPFESWEMGQKAKIAEMERANDLVKQSQKELVQSVLPVMSADDVDVADEVEYPRKAPKPTMPRPGKYHGNRR